MLAAASRPTTTWARTASPIEAIAELHRRLWARLGLERLDRVGFERLAAGCHPLTSARLVKASHTTRTDPITGERVSAGALLRCAGPGQTEVASSTRDQIAKISSSNATASRLLVGSSTASS